MFKAFVDKNCCELEAGTWVPNWGSSSATVQQHNQVMLENPLSQNKQKPVQLAAEAATPVRGGSVRKPASIYNPPVVGISAGGEGVSGEGASMPSTFRVPPTATTSMAYHGQATDAELRHYFTGSPYN